MRELGKLPDSQSARRFAGYLQSLSIETRLDESPGGCTLWVIEEDKVARARTEFEQYLQSPADERYLKAIPLASDLEPVAAAPVIKRRRPIIRSEGLFATPSECRLTLMLIVASVIVTLLYGSAEQRDIIQSNLFIRELIVRGGDVYTFVRAEPLPEVQEGEVWRLVTPIFIHFTAVHLLFNMFWLYTLGGQIERQVGTLRFALLVLLLSIIPNLGQYFLPQVGLENWRLIIPEPSPVFGGMSGVVYGLFGFVWMKMVYQPGCGLFLRPPDILIMMLWFFLCFTGVVGAIANTAHMAGLVLGMMCGYLGAWWNGWGQPSDA